MNRSAAEAKIKQVFRLYAAPTPASSATKGKVYELFCLAELLDYLDANGVSITYIGRSKASFKAAPGGIKHTDPHFELVKSQQTLDLYVNIEVRSLSSAITTTTDRSRHHELDLAIVEHGLSGRPRHDQLVLGVECKAVANFRKSVLKEVLGVRRELSLLNSTDSRLQDFLGSSVAVNADPGSEYWVRYIDSSGDKYSDGAACFGIDFKAWIP